MARPTRPAIGASTRVNSRFSSAARSAASTAVDLRRRLGGDAGAAIALLARHRVLGRQPLGAALLGAGAIARRRRPARSSARSRSTSAWNGRVDLEQQSPWRDQAPSVNDTVEISPETRGRTATVLHGFEPAGELVPFGDVAGDGRGGGDLRQRRRRAWSATPGARGDARRAGDQAAAESEQRRADGKRREHA